MNWTENGEENMIGKNGGIEYLIFVVIGFISALIGYWLYRDIASALIIGIAIGTLVFGLDTLYLANKQQ